MSALGQERTLRR
jgi:hypothetical protein